MVVSNTKLFCPQVTMLTRTASTMTQTQCSWFPSRPENIWIVNKNWCICFNCYVFKYFNFEFWPPTFIRSQWPCGLRRVSAAVRLLRSWVRIPPGAWIFVWCECRVLSGRGLCDEPITRPEEFYRLWCVVVCDLKISRMRVGPQRQGGEDINPSHNLTTDKWPRVIKKFEKSCVEFWGFTDQFKKSRVEFWGYIDQFEKSCVEFWGFVDQLEKSCVEFWGFIDQFEKIMRWVLRIYRSIWKIIRWVLRINRSIWKIMRWVLRIYRSISRCNILIYNPQPPKIPDSSLQCCK